MSMEVTSFLTSKCILSGSRVRLFLYSMGNTTNHEHPEISQISIALSNVLCLGRNRTCDHVSIDTPSAIMQMRRDSDDCLRINLDTRVICEKYLRRTKRYKTIMKLQSARTASLIVIPRVAPQDRSL